MATKNVLTLTDKLATAHTQTVSCNIAKIIYEE
jgi:hypothetical protein